MDQDSFRTLLSRPSSSKSSSATSVPAANPRPSILQAGRRPKEPPPPPPTEATFKPRKVAKLPPGYRDRAAERRDDAAEYAEGAAKGLNLELLEKAKAGHESSKAEDDALEEAFNAAAAPETPSETPKVPKKRTRDDLLKALKNKREEGDATPMEVEGSAEAKSLEAAKQKGKFRPISQPASETKAKEEKRKKKKRKVATDAQPAQPSQTKELIPTSSTPSDPQPAAAPGAGSSEERAHEPSPETSAGPSKLLPTTMPQDDDVDIDIFADVGEYEGVDLGDDSEDEKPASTRKEEKDEASGSGPPKRANWFGEEEPEPMMISRPKSPTPPLVPEKEEGEHDEDKPVRLAPLTSSSIHDIKSFLEVDKALEKEQKRKERKEKKKKQQP